MHCPVCAGAVRHLGMVAPPNRAGHDAFAIAECDRCGLSYSDPAPGPDVVAAFYSSPDAYQAEYGVQDFSWQRAQHEKDLRRVMRRRPPPARLLDVGCSFGLLLSVALQLGYEAFGVEPNFAAAEHARVRVGEHRVFHGMLADLPAPRDAFDVISMSHVFEHFTDFRGAIRLAAGMLAPGGVLAVQAPNRRCWHTLRRGPDYRPIEHPYYWTYSALMTEARRAGLRPSIAPVLWPHGGWREAAKEAALVIEHGAARALNFGLKSTLEMHATRP